MQFDTIAENSYSNLPTKQNAVSLRKPKARETEKASEVLISEIPMPEQTVKV